MTSDAVNLESLTPLLTSLALSFVCGLAGRSQHKATEEADTFSIGPVVAW
jgi:hypothetical protein